MSNKNDKPQIKPYRHFARNGIDLIEAGVISFDEWAVHGALRLRRNHVTGIVVSSPKKFSLEMGKSHDFCKKAFAALKEKGWIQYNSVSGSQRPFPIKVIDMDFRLHFGSEVEVQNGMVGLNVDENASTEIELHDLGYGNLTPKFPISDSPVQDGEEKTRADRTARHNDVAINTSDNVGLSNSPDLLDYEYEEENENEKDNEDCVPISSRGPTGKSEILTEQENPPPSLSINSLTSETKPKYQTIHRSDIPEYTVSIWNIAGTEESVVIDGERFLVVDDGETVEPEAQLNNIETDLPDPEAVEAESADNTVTVNQAKMAQLLSNIGGKMTAEVDNSNERAPPPSMSRKEMRARLDRMDWEERIRQGDDGDASDARDGV